MTDAIEITAETVNTQAVNTAVNMTRAERKALRKSPISVHNAFAPFMQTITTPTKLDYNTPANEMRMVGLDIQLSGMEPIPTTPEFRKQMYENLGSGMGTYGRHLEKIGQFDLLNENVNRLKQLDDSNRIVRTLDGFARAEVSDRFLAIDNDRIFGRVLEAFSGIENRFRFLKSHVSANSASVKFISAEKFAVLGNRTLFYGFMISNSEIGNGYCKFETFLFDSFCENGCIFGKRQLAVLKFMHKGAQILQTGRINLQLDTAKQSEINLELDKAMRISAETVPNHGLKEKLEFAYAKRIEGNLLPAVNETIKRYSIPMSAEAVINNMESQDGNTVYAIQAGITKYAQTLEDYEDRMKLEIIGGAILEDTGTLYPILNEVSKIA